MSPMNNRLLVPRKTPGLLDLVPGAAAAYSLRSLSNSYADPVVTVRRSSDDAEDSFTASEVADGTLAAFCGAGDGFVKTWHSQTGSNDATQTTAGYQPKIVSSGVVVLKEGKPAIQFDGSDDYMLHSPVKKASYISLSTCNVSDGGFIHATPPSNTVSSVSNWGAEYFASGLFGAPTYWQASAFGYSHFGTWNTALPQPQELSFVGGGANIYPNVYKNGVLQTDSALNIAIVAYSSATYAFIGCNGKGDGSSRANFWPGTIQELLFYPTDISAQRELAEGLVAWGYSV